MLMDKHASEFKKMFRGYGFDVRCDPDTEHATGVFAGRSDCTCIRSGLGVYVEIKSGNNRWATKYKDPKKGWTVKQREYGEWAENQNGSEYYIALFVGSDPPNYDQTKYKPRRAYLIPFKVALATVQEAEALCGFIPYRLGKGSLKSLVAAKLSCEDRFSEFRLIRTTGEWTIPPYNSFSKYLQGE